MAEIVQSLFGVTPQMYQQQQQDRVDAQALRFAQLDPFQQAQFSISRGANMLGGAIGGALGGQDPELQRITMRQQIARQLNPNDPASIQQAIAMLQQAGDTDGAMLLQGEYRKLQESNALVAQRGAAAAASTAAATRERTQASPKEVLLAKEVALLSGPEGSPEYNAAYASSLQSQISKPDAKPVVVGNALVDPGSGREIYKGPSPEKYSAHAQELIDAGLTPGTEPFQNRMLEYVGNKAKGAAKGTGNFTIGGITIDTGEAAKAAGKVVGTNVANIENQYSMLTAFDDAIKLVDQGIYGGAYGPEQAAATKYSLGLLGNKKKLENTEVFLSNIGEIVIPRLVQFGGNDSNEELKYLQKVVAGDQRLEPAAVKRILASAEKKVRNNIARLQKQAEAGKTGAELPTAPVTAPAAPKATKRFNPQTGKLEPVTGN